MKAIRSLVILAAALGAAGCSSRPPASESEPTPVAVTVGAAELTDLAAAFEAGGIVRARSTAVIASRVMAPITMVHVRAGDRARRGARLVTLDSRELTATSAGARAALDAAAEVSSAAQADIQAADAAVHLARATFERINALVEKRSATRQELDQATHSLRTAEAQLRAAQSRAAASSASRDAARASLDAARVGVTYSVLTAPFDGVITERKADPGSMAVPGMPLLILEDESARQIEVQLDEARAARIARGDRVAIRLDTLGARWIDSTVLEIALVDPASHSFLIKVATPEAATLRSGLFGRVRFSGAPRRTLTIPQSALFRRGQLSFVFGVDDDGRARLRPVSAGLVADDRVEILAGLHNGDKVVLSPPPSLADGVTISDVAASRDRPPAGERR